MKAIILTLVFQNLRTGLRYLRVPTNDTMTGGSMFQNLRTGLRYLRANLLVIGACDHNVSKPSNRSQVFEAWRTDFEASVFGGFKTFEQVSGI